MSEKHYSKSQNLRGYFSFPFIIDEAYNVITNQVVKKEDAIISLNKN